ncbi:MAG: D-tyrosyl-tRNA(Tyr) deacylase [Lachnospiraceae bacterium]|nr:D-tyrosyl-tRNA(Tyr) deacylase [Candidatus Merdinaster equi]
MKFLIQRVKSASVSVDFDEIGRIDEGCLVFVGVSENDSEAIADRMIDKLVKLRIFEDEQGKTNLSISDAGGKYLIVSQFTLYADVKKCNRPSFVSAGNPALAEKLYDYVISTLRDKGFEVEHGSFGADMKVSLVNDGPFTIIMDSDELWPGR